MTLEGRLSCQLGTHNSALLLFIEFEKTEVHKRQIDDLMDKLITIVNRRDELAQQRIAHEQE